jgi:S-adenosylmethionine hydrolase
MAARRALITLLTDFGLRDAYVGALKGVILGINPEAVLVDITPEIPPQDITAGAFVLAEAAPYFPPGTIHLAVVDPGVGTSRRGLAASARGHYFVGPDNGLLHLMFRDAPDLSIVSVEYPAYFRPEVAATFHGRDVFAPAAAHLSLEVPLRGLGPAVTDPILLPIPSPTFIPEAGRGEIIYVDRFGNLVSNIRWDVLVDWLGGREFHLRIGSHNVRRWGSTYAEVAPGELLVLKGSHGYLEIAVNQASAADRLGLGIGAALTLHPG